jgi:copper chaperone CopZ
VIRRVLHLDLDGLLAVHAARAVHTALGAVDGIVSATVTLAGADIEVQGPFEAADFADRVRAALAPIGIGLRAVTVVQSRSLPQA